ncbi:MAG: YaiI/YqxD family protein [Spirochaetes bacterium]|nr:YaiI/YqxD family protein [Spirochaetota bacterium]
MNIYADADALPNAVKEILFRAAERTGIPLLLVANTALGIPRSELIRSVVVAAGPDEADKHIASLVRPGDLVITADLPLALRVVEKGGVGLDPRGTLYTENNIRSKIASRDLLMALREGGAEIGGPAPYKPRDRQAFANQLEQYLARAVRA